MGVHQEFEHLISLSLKNVDVLHSLHTKNCNGTSPHKKSKRNKNRGFSRHTLLKADLPNYLLYRSDIPQSLGLDGGI